MQRTRHGIFVIAIVCLTLMGPVIGSAQDVHVDTVSSPPRIAPGDAMPVRVKLTNFGSEFRADVSTTYSIIDASGKIILEESDTVAVETTASFIHSMILPTRISSGTYTLRTSVQYVGQKTPAVSSYQFRIERKVAGIFLGDLLRYIVLLFFGILAALGTTFALRRRFHPTTPHDYSDVSSAVRIYYEIVDGIVHEMRLHAGDKAIAMATNVPGLDIDESGKVTNISGDLAGVVASLVAEYEKNFGKRVNLVFGRNAKARMLTETL